jgi:hypothetical protein
MDADGVVAQILYTTVGFTLFGMIDADLQEACFRIYNDWLAEFCNYAPKRLGGLGLISLFDVDGVRANSNAARNWASKAG